jgi:hypothetical protein
MLLAAEADELTRKYRHEEELMSEYGGVGPWIFLYIQILSRCGGPNLIV